MSGVQFLTKATLDGDYDTLTSPSARLVVGKVVENGAGQPSASVLAFCGTPLSLSQVFQ